MGRLRSPGECDSFPRVEDSHLREPRDASDVLVRVRDYCIPKGISFKHLRSVNMLLMRNAKYAPPGRQRQVRHHLPARRRATHARSSASWARCSPVSPARTSSATCAGRRPALRPLRRLRRALLRATRRGELVPAIEDGDGPAGARPRDPAFHVPDWVTLPDFLDPHLAARNAATVDRPAVPRSRGAALLQRRRRLRRRPTPAPASRSCSRRAGRTRGSPPTAPTRSPGCEREQDGAGAAVRARRGARGARLASPSAITASWSRTSSRARPLNTFFAQRHPLLDPDPDAGRRRRVHRLGAAGPRRRRARRSRRSTRAARLQRPAHVQHHGRARTTTVALIDFEAAAPAARTPPADRRPPRLPRPADRRGLRRSTDYALACLRLALFLPTDHAARCSTAPRRPTWPR